MEEKELLVYSFKILDGEEIFIKNSLILYMFDTLKWINTLDKFRIKKIKDYTITVVHILKRTVSKN
jgi:hypothetical protein